MILFKKKNLFLFIFLLFLNIKSDDELNTEITDQNNNSVQISEDSENVISETEKNVHFEDLNLDACEEIDYIARFEELKPKVQQTIKRSFIDTLGFLLLCGLDQLLKEDLYLKTHSILKRPINSLPIFLIFHTEHICQDKLLRLSLFGDSTYKSFFTDKSPFINSFVGFDCPNIKSKLDKLKLCSSINIEEVIELFRVAKKQDRRFGLQIQTLYNFDNFSLEITIPFLYQEYNYFFTEQEKEDILNSNLFGNSSLQLEEKELRKHAVSDKVGFGDASIQIGYLTYKKDKVCAKAGIVSTIPIAFPIKEGLLGSNFNNKLIRAKLNLKQIVQARDTDPELFQNLLKEFGFNALHWMNAMTLETPLGNYGHFGLGAFFEPHIRIDESVSLRTRVSVEYLFPAKEERFFLTIKNCADFNHEEFEMARENEQTAKKAVEFLAEQITETLFPNKYTSEIAPGFSFQFTISPQFRLNEWSFSFGYDYWYQQKEEINYVCNPANIPLNIKKGTKPKAFQSKLFANLAYNKVKKNYDWVISLNAEETLASFGVGHDFALSLGFEFNF